MSDVRVQVTVEVDDVSMYFERRFEKVPTARVRSVMGGALSAMTGDALEHLPEDPWAPYEQIKGHQVTVAEIRAFLVDVPDAAHVRLEKHSGDLRDPTYYTIEVSW